MARRQRAHNVLYLRDDSITECRPYGPIDLRVHHGHQGIHFLEKHHIYLYREDFH